MRKIQYRFFLLLVIIVVTSISIYLFQIQIRMSAIKRLRNEEYVIKKIKEELGVEYEFIKLYEPEVVRYNQDLWDWVKHHTSSTVVRVFIAYLKDPESSEAEENHFYFGFIDSRGNVFTLPKNTLLI